MSDHPEFDIDKLAQLARIELSSDEKEQICEKLSGVLDHFDKLSKVDVEGVEPMAHPFPFYNVWREDEPGQTLAPSEALMNAPAVRENQVVVPKVVE